MRISCAFSLAIALLAIPAAGQEQVAAGDRNRLPSACTVTARPDRLEGMTPGGDLILASGGLAKLSAIRIPDKSPYRDDAQAWLRARIGRSLLVEDRSERDRWGRLPVRIRMAGDTEALDLAQGLVETGLALVDPGIADAFCQPELLALEETARKRNLGLWADALYKPIDAEQTNRLQDRFGTFALVEGRVRTIGERKQRIYLNFGGHWAEDFTIIIPKRTWKSMADRGVDAAALKGQRIRARGILEPWQGASLTIVVPEMIERLEGKRLPR